jgi:hypothetical protein
MWPGSHGVVVNPQEGLMEWSVFDMDPYVNPYVDFRGVALNPGNPAHAMSVEAYLMS